MLDEHLGILQAVRLKGRTSVADAAAATGLGDAVAGRALRELAGDSLTTEANGRHRLTPAGRERLTEWLASEREGVDQAALGALYTEFTGCNHELKQLAFAWQQREGAANDHTDAVYDQAILDRLAGMHARFAPVLARLIAVAPRLAPYPLRLVAAIARVAAGDHAFFLRPVIDSYHTVWMELHEDLMGLLGRTRQEEAIAGRAE